MIARAALLCVLALGACHHVSQTSARRVVSDGLGRRVELGAVQRVVSLAPSSTEIVYALGASELLVGVDRYSDYPAAAHALPQVGTDMDPSLEKVLALRPDLVLVATSANEQHSVEALARAGIAVFVSRSDSLEGIFADIEGIGRAIDRAPRAAALVGSLRDRLAAITARTRALAPTPCAVVVWPAPLVVAGRGNHVGDLIAAAGGRNVVDETTQAFPSYSTERLIAKAPAVLLVGSHSDGAPPMDPIERLGSIPAVRDHRIHVVDGDLVFRPGPRVLDGIDLLLPLLHPELSRSDGGAR